MPRVVKALTGSDLCEPPRFYRRLKVLEWYAPGSEEIFGHILWRCPKKVEQALRALQSCFVSLLVALHYTAVLCIGALPQFCSP